MKVFLMTPEWNREFEAEAVFLPGSASPFEVLQGHAPLISTLDEGEIRWRGPEGEEKVGIKGGAVRVSSDIVEICAEV